MGTLLFRLCGPMQSWGTRSRFTERDTELEPSKSGVIGLVCAALGRPREQDISDLAALGMGVRVDREGTMARDYHTAGTGSGIVRAGGGVSQNAVLSNRYYLAGADFLVGLEGQSGLLATIEAALKQPVWQLSLGRKAFVPGVPIALPKSGMRDVGLRGALEAEPWPLVPVAWALPSGTTSHRLRLIVESSFGDPNHEVRMDQPLSTAFKDRTFGPRPILQDYFEKERTDVPQQAHA